MSANDNFGKNPADETDIDQLVRVMKELENAFRKVSLISDQLSQVTFRDMFKTSLDFMKLEKQRYQDAKKHADDMSKIDQKTKDRITIIAAQNKSDKIIMKQRSLDATQRAKERSELLTQHDLMVRSHILLRNRMKNSTDQLDFFVTSLTKGLSVGDVGGQLQKIIRNVYNITDDVSQLEKEKTDAEKKLLLIIDQQSDAYKKLKKEIDDLALKISSAKNNSQGSTVYKMMGGQQGKMATTLQVLGEFAKTHATGLVLGAAAGGMILWAIKKAIDVSPVFQNVLKLLEFGFMLILRPIGDFFGFVFRPIMVYMLRSFILPFFRHVYPFFREWGTKIGEALASPTGMLAVALGGGGAIVAALIVISTAIKGLCGCMGGRGVVVGGGGKGVKGGKTTSGTGTTNNKSNSTKIKDWWEDEKNKWKLKYDRIKIFFGDMGDNIKIAMDNIRVKLKEFHDNIKVKLESLGTRLNNLKISIGNSITGISNKIVEFRKSISDSWDKSKIDMDKKIKDVKTSAISFFTKIGGIFEKIKGAFSMKNIINAIGGGSIIGKALRFLGLYDLLVSPEELGGWVKLTGSGTEMKLGVPELQSNFDYMKKNAGLDKATEYYEEMAKKYFPDRELYTINENDTYAQLKNANPLDHIPNSSELVNDFFNGLFGGNTKQNYNGGIITEPIIGYGESGQKYSFGERGAEMITPFGKTQSYSSSDQKVIINVYGDVTDKTMAEFERKVLQVLKNSNSRRGM